MVGAPEGSGGPADDKVAVGGSVDHRVEVFALATGASAEACPESAVKAFLDQEGAKVGISLCVLGDLKSAAVDGSGHGKQAVEAFASDA